MKENVSGCFFLNTVYNQTCWTLYLATDHDSDDGHGRHLKGGVETVKHDDEMVCGTGFGRHDQAVQEETEHRNVGQVSVGNVVLEQTVRALQQLKHTMQTDKHQSRGVSSCRSLGWPVLKVATSVLGVGGKNTGWHNVWLSEWCNLTPAAMRYATLWIQLLYNLATLQPGRSFVLRLSLLHIIHSPFVRILYNKLTVSSTQGWSLSRCRRLGLETWFWLSRSRRGLVSTLEQNFKHLGLVSVSSSKVSFTFYKLMLSWIFAHYKITTSLNSTLIIFIQILFPLFNSSGQALASLWDKLYRPGLQCEVQWTLHLFCETDNYCRQASAYFIIFICWSEKLYYFDIATSICQLFFTESCD